jgi:hypothetical protein
MILTETALAQIKGPDVRRELSDELNCTDQTIMRYIKVNEDNGPLTSAGAMVIIRSVTGLTDGEILEKAIAGGTQVQT